VAKQVAAELGEAISPKVNDTKTLHQNMERTFFEIFFIFFLKRKVLLL